MWHIECNVHPNALHPIKCGLLSPRSVYNKTPFFTIYLLTKNERFFPFLRHESREQTLHQGKTNWRRYCFHLQLTEKMAYRFLAMKCTYYRLQMHSRLTIIEVLYHLDCINFLNFIDNFTTYQKSRLYLTR